MFFEKGGKKGGDEMREKLITTITFVLIIMTFGAVLGPLLRFSLNLYGWFGASTIGLLFLELALVGGSVFVVLKIWR